MTRLTCYRLFRLGGLPTNERQVLESEGIRVLYEGLIGSLTYKNYRAPGKVFLGRRRWFVGSLAITEQRFAAYAYSRRIFSALLGSPDLSKWRISVEGGKRLVLAGNASDFAPDQSGGLEFRFAIPDAESAARLLNKGVA